MKAKLTIRYFFSFAFFFFVFFFFTSMLEKQTYNFLTGEKANTIKRKFLDGS